MIMMKQEYKYLMIAREAAEKYKYPNFATETALNTSIRLQWKLQSGIQVSKSVQRKLHSGMCTITQGKFFFFFFLKWGECGERSKGNGVEVI